MEGQASPNTNPTTPFTMNRHASLMILDCEATIRSGIKSSRLALTNPSLLPNSLRHHGDCPLLGELSEGESQTDMTNITETHIDCW